MVLGGTCLTALVVYYVFDFDWSFNLAMVSVQYIIMYCPTFILFRIRLFTKILILHHFHLFLTLAS